MVIFSAKGKRREKRRARSGMPDDMKMFYLPIGRAIGAAKRLPRLPGWKSIKVHDNTIDLTGLGKVCNLVIRGIHVRVVGKTLFIEGGTSD